MDQNQLIECAKDARSLSYSPYSHFAVGAALVCNDGSVYVGANIENSSFPLCMCAERNAVYNAMMDGKTTDDFVALAIIADTAGPCSPCGACRQVLSELFPSKAPIYLANLKGDVKVTNTEELLPFAFAGEDL
ncbi:MAG: cytidine deaminase [Bacilli bacterium]